MYNVLDYLEESARKHPNKIAFADIEKEISYQDLVIKAKCIGNHLSEIFDPGMPVPIFMDKSVDTICLFFGVVYAGCFYTMLDTKQPMTRLNHIMDTLETDKIVTSNKYLSILERLEFKGQLIMIEDLFVCHQTEEIKIKKHVDTMPLYCIFTSGSTGVPKGVLVSHRNVIDFIDVFVDTFRINENDVIGNQAPWDFDVSVKDIYSTIKAGATMQIIPKQFFSMPTKLLDFLCEREVTTIIWAVSAVCIISTLKGFEYRIPKQLTKIMFSGEVMPVKQLQIWQKYIPNAMYVNLYGPTEITCNCTYHIIDREYELGEIIPIGKSFANEKVFLLNNQDCEVTKQGDIGEICVGGTAVSLGYYNNKEQTQKAFCQNPLNKSYIEIIYRTGDLGYYNEDGNLCFTSRKDFQIKHMGHRIELGEIENMMNKVEVIQRSCCIFENNRIIAFYDGEIERRELIRVLKKDLPVFMIPNVFYKIDRFPITKNGKIDRKKLSDMIKEEFDVSA